jgi:hypothetical protein
MADRPSGIRPTDIQTRQRRQRGHRLIQAGQARRVFQVEIVERILAQQLARQRGLAALPGTGEDHDALSKLPLYQGLGIPEVWLWRNADLEVHVLDPDGYRRTASSRLLPGLDLALLAVPA